MLSLLALTLLAAAAAPTPPSADVVAPPPGEGPTGAFPSDVPKRWHEHGRRALELDLYLGPSYSSSGGAGLGVRAVIVSRQAAASSFGLKWHAAGGGGLYGLGGTVGPQAEAIGRAQAGFGYYSITGAEGWRRTRTSCSTFWRSTPMTSAKVDGDLRLPPDDRALATTAATPGRAASGPPSSTPGRA